MRVGVAADSAGNIAALHRALRLLQDSLGCEKVFFLGGNWADVDACTEATVEAPIPPAGPTADELAKLFIGALDRAGGTDPGLTAVMDLPIEDHVVRVAERGSTAPADERKVMDMLGSTLCVLVHDKADLTREDIANAHLILHGKSRKGGVVRIGPRAFITPGSVSGDAPSVAVLDAQATQIDVEFYDLDGRLLLAESLGVGGGTKFSAQ